MFAFIYGLAFGFPYQNHNTPFDETIHNVENMVRSDQYQSMARQNGLRLVNVTWEDTGRSKGSSVGPNISDMTIGVRDSHQRLHPMPVYRFDNFSDKTADIRSDHFFVRTGNEKGESLYDTSLKELLQNIDQYLHHDWTGSQNGLWNVRDQHVLVSAQACFLPIPKGGEAIFTPVLYNYQSSVGNPAVLAIVATREGTSMQVVENDSGYMSETLFFNQNGERAPFQAARLSDFTDQGGDKTTPFAEMTADSSLNAVLIIQVPLKHKTKPRFPMNFATESTSKSMAMDLESARLSDVEDAVISHGDVEGPFKELNGLSIKRDDRFPVRVTVQFYKATSNGTVSHRDIEEIREQIDRVYAQGDYVGSLVTDGRTQRPTEMKATSKSIWAYPIWQWHKSF
ncbi:MAG: hypothetical protein VX278_19140 [Myxococcota bacterium]|nr:hypothetical protein [Myxococcota bacterium]